MGMGFQFIHMETYSRKADSKGRSVDYVLNEACRNPDASLHVENPLPPELVAGISLDELRASHALRSDEAYSIDKNGKHKKARSDQHTIATIIASHPGGEPAEVAKWEALTVQWMREQYGDRLATVIRHVDEGHPHLHAYILPDDACMRSKILHPGWLAKDKIKQESIISGDDSKTANKKGDIAYKSAMRGWQDSYWHAVGIPCGLTRIGPGRRRLERPEWKAEQAQAARASELVDLVAQLETRAEKSAQTVERGSSLVSALRDQVDHLKAEKAAIIQAAEVSKAEADKVIRSANGIVAKAKKQAAGILARARKEGEALRNVGNIIGGLFQGFLAASPSRVEAAVRAEEREIAKKRESELLAVNGGLRKQLTAVTRERDEMQESLTNVASERDTLRAMKQENTQMLARSLRIPV